MILIVTQTFAPATGGMENYMTGLATHLAHAGKQVMVLADATAQNFTPQASYELKRFGGPRPWRRLRKRCAISKIVAREEITGIFCDSWKSVEALPQNLACPVAVIAHGAEYPPHPSRSKMQRIASALTRATKIISNSHYTQNSVRAFLPFADDPRLTLIYPPIAPLDAPDEKARQKIADIVGARRPVISVLARLEPRKGIDRVILALPELIKRHPTLTFLIAGGGEDKDRLQELARDQGVGAHVVFLGRVDEALKSALLEASDIFAMPVRRVGTSVEGFGISYIEAAFFGVPSVGGTNCGAADAIINNETGLLCDGENQAEITAGLARLLDDEALRRQFGNKARIRARHDMLWAQALPRFAAAIETGVVP